MTNKPMVKDKNDDHNNASGYYDPTAFSAINNLTYEERRFNKLIRTIFSITELAGFRIEGRIKFVDNRTGRVWE